MLQKCKLFWGNCTLTNKERNYENSPKRFNNEACRIKGYEKKKSQVKVCELPCCFNCNATAFTLCNFMIHSIQKRSHDIFVLCFCFAVPSFEWLTITRDESTCRSVDLWPPRQAKSILYRLRLRVKYFGPTSCTSLRLIDGRTTCAHSHTAALFCSLQKELLPLQVL